MKRLTDQERADAFRAWYSGTGHWVYDGRADAVRVWRERGINGRPQHTAGAEALLAAWVTADFKDPLLGKLVRINELAPNERVHHQVGRVLRQADSGAYVVDFCIRGSVEVSAMHFALYASSLDEVPA